MSYSSGEIEVSKKRFVYEFSCMINEKPEKVEDCAEMCLCAGWS